jgi:hypothetical protein
MDKMRSAGTSGIYGELCHGLNTSMMNTYPVVMVEFGLMRGVQNEVLFQVRNIDRKPVSLPDTTLTINIVDPRSNTLLMSRDLISVNAAKGVYQLVILTAEMDTWVIGPLRWSIVHSRDNGTVMLWIDRNYTPFGTLMLLEGPLPGPAATISTAWQYFTLAADGWYYSPMLPGAMQDGYINAMQTFYLDLSSFVGTVRIDTATVVQPALSDWSVAFIQSYNFINAAEIDIAGNFQWLRIAINLTAGSVIQADFKG